MSHLEHRTSPKSEDIMICFIVIKVTVVLLVFCYDGLVVNMWGDGEMTINMKDRLDKGIWTGGTGVHP